MIAFLLRRLRSEAGLASATALLAATAMAAVAGAVLANGVFLSDNAHKDDSSKRALQVADAGLDLAIQRLNVLKPNAGECITAAKQATPANGWCPATAPESVAPGATFTYSVSGVNPASCAGTPSASASTEDRCVVSTGLVNGLRRRVEMRVTSTTSSRTIFSSNCFNPADSSTCSGLLGDREVKIEEGANVSGGLASNDKIECRKNPTVTGQIQLGPIARTPKGCELGNLVRRTTPFLLPRPNFWNPYTGINSATSNDNGWINSFPRSQPQNVPYNASTRTLTLKDNQSLTLNCVTTYTIGGSNRCIGVYNFCSFSLGKNARISIPPGALIVIFLDMPEAGTGKKAGGTRAGSGCPNGSGKFESRDAATISMSPSGNPPALDPRNLQIYAWGSTQNIAKGKTEHKITLPIANDYAAAVYAPYSEVKFAKLSKKTPNKGTLYGGIAARKIRISKNMHFVWDPRLIAPDATQVTTISAYQRTAWRECRPNNATANPDAGCGAG